MHKYDPFTLAPNSNQPKTAPDQAYWTIYQKILAGELAAGEKLSLRKMASMSKVSVIPVIEALRRLEKDGLVESRPQWGHFVAIPSLDAIRSHFALREAVECQVARLLSEGIDETQADHLRDLAKELDWAKQEARPESEVDQLHFNLHMTMAEFTGMQSLVDALRQVNLFFLLLKVTSYKRPPDLPPVFHESLIDKVLSRNPDKAEAAMRAHVQNGYRRIVASCQPALEGGNPG